jgi:hypothetical protein
MTAAVSRVWGWEQSTTGVLSTHTSGPRLLAGVFRHCPTLGAGGTSPVVEARVDDEGAEEDRVGSETAGERASCPQPVQPKPTTMARAAARRSGVMSPPSGSTRVLPAQRPRNDRSVQRTRAEEPRSTVGE